MNENCAFTVETLSPSIGAVVHGLDLRNTLSAHEVDAIKELWLQHQVIFFRNQNLSPEQHLQFASNFGDFHIHPAAPYACGNPALMVIHTDQNSHRNNGSGWHSDVSADEKPPMGSILHIHRTPSVGGDTLFSNMYAVFESLSPAMQQFLRSLTAHHVSDYTGHYGDHKPQREFPEATHPVVRTHPVTGRDALFVNSGFTRKINELSSRESSVLLRFLFDQVQNPRFQCRFHWEPNSIAMWDNRCVQHMAIWDYFPETRSGLRVTLRGDKPYLNHA